MTEDNNKSTQVESNQITTHKRSMTCSRAICDILAGCGAAFLVSPILTVIDKAIVESASGAKPMGQSLKTSFKFLFTQPVQFLKTKEFMWLYAIYLVTFNANNLIDSYCSINKIDMFFPKLVGVTAMNMYVAILKDRAFARYFGTTAPKGVPAASIGSWLCRDVITVGAAFILPELASRYLQEQKGMSKSKADVYGQFGSTTSMQLIAGPFHLLGYDLYNRQNLSESRIPGLVKELPKTVSLRVLRIFPGYGLGGIGNKRLRENLHYFNEGEGWNKYE